MEELKTQELGQASDCPRGVPRAHTVSDRPLRVKSGNTLIEQSILFAAKKAFGPTSRRDAIAMTRSDLAHISTGLAIWSNASSTRSNGAVGSQLEYDKLAANYLAFIQPASIRLWLRANECSLYVVTAPVTSAFGRSPRSRCPSTM